jgi:chromosome partitioning protein
MTQPWLLNVMFHVEHAPNYPNSTTLFRFHSSIPLLKSYLWEYSGFLTESASTRVLAIANQKGGVAKTTTAINLATALALDGYQVLLVDCDPQGNASSGLGIAKSQVPLSTYDVLLGEATIEEAIQPTQVENLRVVPSTNHLIGANIELVGVEKREFRLKNALEAVRGKFEFVVLDCPPALDLLTLNALVATQHLIVPMQAEYFALEGISELMNTVERVRAAFNPELTLAGVVLTMYDERTNLAQQVTDNLRGYFGEKLMKASIPRNVRLAEAPSHGLPVALYDPASRGAEAYRALGIEVLHRMGLESRRPMIEPVATSEPEPTEKVQTNDNKGHRKVPRTVRIRFR